MTGAVIFIRSSVTAMVRALHKEVVALTATAMLIHTVISTVLNADVDTVTSTVMIMHSILLTFSVRLSVLSEAR